MVARANVAYDRLLSVVLHVLATCSFRGDTVVRKQLACGRSETTMAREGRGEATGCGRGARVCGRAMVLEREAERNAGGVAQFAESGVHPSLPSTRYTSTRARAFSHN